MGRKIRLAVVGIGRISTAHLRAIQNSPDVAELVAVMSRSEERARRAAEEYGAATFYTNYEDVLKDSTIDAVVLCTPNTDHHWQTIKAAKAGKHILVEKPMAMDYKEAAEMLDAAEQNDVTLMVAQCRRFFKAIEKAKEELPQIGEIVDTTHYLGVNFNQLFAEWWSGMKHLIIELNAPHLLDTSLYFLDETPLTVYAAGGSFSEHFPGTSQATILLTFPSGATASVLLSFHCNPPRNERMIVGTKGTMRIKDEKDLWIGDRLVETEDYGHYLEGGINFDRQIQEFCTSILERREPQASGREILRVMRVLEAVKLSLDEKRVVALEEIQTVKEIDQTVL